MSGYSAPCPICKARPEAPCVAIRGPIRECLIPHKTRIELAKLRAGEPVPHRTPERRLLFLEEVVADIGSQS